MIPQISYDIDPSNLLEKCQPTRWEHLGGPMSWMTDFPDTYRVHKEYGPVVDVAVEGKIGEMLEHFNKHKQFSRKAYLFSGQHGIGKTALIQLMTVTHLARDHKAVTLPGYLYEEAEEETHVTVLNEDTGKPLVINPVTDDIVNFGAVQHAMDNTATLSKTMVDGFNAATINKSAIDTIAESFAEPLHHLGGRRVVIFSEFDNVGTRQVPSLKKALDPGGSVPDGLLVLADTNHFQKVKHSLDEAGVKRFRVIRFKEWNVYQLEHWAYEYLNAFGVEFDFDSIDASDRIEIDEDNGDTIETFIAWKANGSVRTLLDIIQQITTLNRPVTAKDILDFAEESANSEDQGASRLIGVYTSKYLKGSIPVHAIVQQGINQDLSIARFADELVFWMLRYAPEALEAAAPYISKMHQEAAQFVPDQSTLRVKWAACTQAFVKIGEAIKNAPRSSGAQTKGSRRRRRR